jgi:hypothetical protein
MTIPSDWAKAHDLNPGDSVFFSPDITGKSAHISFYTAEELAALIAHTSRSTCEASNVR